MMKWLWLLIAIVACAAAWQAETPGLLALYLFAALVAIVASFLGFLAARVGAVAQTQMHRESALLATQAARRSGAAGGLRAGGESPAESAMRGAGSGGEPGGGPAR